MTLSDSMSLSGLLASLSNWHTYDQVAAFASLLCVGMLCISWEVGLAISEELLICLVLFHSTRCAFHLDSGAAA